MHHLHLPFSEIRPVVPSGSRFWTVTAVDLKKGLNHNHNTICNEMITWLLQMDWFFTTTGADAPRAQHR